MVMKLRELRYPRVFEPRDPPDPNIPAPHEYRQQNCCSRESTFRLEGRQGSSSGGARPVGSIVLQTRGAPLVLAWSPR